MSRSRLPGKPRVLLLVENNPYPRDFRVRREANTLRDAGYQVSVIAPRDRAEPWSERIDGVDVYRFPAPFGGSGVLSYALEFGYATGAILLLTAWLWVRHGVDVIHAGNPPDTLFAVGAIFKLLGARVVFDQHDLAPEAYLSRFAEPRQNLVYRALRLVERLAYANADVVITTNASYAAAAIARGGRKPEDVFVVRNGPPLSYGPVRPDPATVARARHMIGYVGTIGPQDGVDYLIRAMQELVVTMGRRDVAAVVIGDGDALESVTALAAELGAAQYIDFTGRLPEEDVRRVLSAAHVCVQPDPFSPLNDKSSMNKLMEYMALGKPTVAFDLLETRHSAQEAALYVRPNDVREFALKVAWLLDHAAERDRMGALGQLRVRRALAWEFSALELLRVYSEGLKLSGLMDPHGPPRRMQSASTDTARTPTA